MSGKGVLFTTQSPLAEGMHVELLVDWPALLDGATRLRLVIQGRVKRSADAETALVIEHYEFRTRSALMAVAS